MGNVGAEYRSIVGVVHTVNLGGEFGIIPYLLYVHPFVQCFFIFYPLFSAYCAEFSIGSLILLLCLQVV